MKWFRRILTVAVLVYLPIAGAEPRALLADIPTGFSAPGLMEQIMNGEIVLEEQLSTSTEFVEVYRAFFNKTSADAYAALATNYPKYPDMISQVEEAKQTGVNADRTIFTYWMKLNVQVGPFHQTLTPEGRHTLKINASGESTVRHEITNYQEYIELASETTRLVPYQTGILVEDTVHAKLKKANPASGIIKKQLQKLFKDYLTAFRDNLQASY